jgi:hypothetical protein
MGDLLLDLALDFDGDLESLDKGDFDRLLYRLCLLAGGGGGERLAEYEPSRRRLE